MAQAYIVCLLFDKKERHESNRGQCECWETDNKKKKTKKNNHVMVMETYHYGKFKFDIHNNMTMMRNINFGVIILCGQKSHI